MVLVDCGSGVVVDAASPGRRAGGKISVGLRRPSLGTAQG